MSFTSNAIVAKAKSLYGICLKESDYQELLKKKAILDIANFLKSKPTYQEKLKNVNELSARRGHVEHLIKENLFDQYMRLIKFVHLKDKKFYLLNFIKIESDLILQAIRSISSEEEEEVIRNIPRYFERYTKLDLQLLSKVSTFNDILDAIKKTDYYKILLPKLIKNELKGLEYLNIEKILDLYYYQKVFEVIEKYYHFKVKTQLKDIFQTKIEIENIIKIYRLKKFYKASFDVINDSLIHIYSRISKRQMNEIIQIDNPNDILKYLQKSEFNKFTDNKDYIYIEYFGEKIEYNLAKRYIYFSNKAPLVYQAFVILLEIETQNITNIIESIRYGIDESEIRQMLIF